MIFQNGIEKIAKLHYCTKGGLHIPKQERQIKPFFSD